MGESLQNALHEVSAPAELPWPLPLAHVSVARWFETIVADARLKPRDCKVFGRRLLYLSYGGVFYRSENQQTENACELPLAFLFSPEIIENVSEAYPFDSGAMKAGRFGELWNREFASFEKDFQVVPNRDSLSSISSLVYHLWGNNQDYLKGTPDPSSGAKPEPFPLLYRFFSADLSSKGIDHRQRTIECIASAELRFDRTLMWVGYPNILERNFIDLCKKTRPWVPECFPYPSHRNFNPARLGEVLEQQAALQVERFASRK